MEKEEEKQLIYLLQEQPEQGLAVAIEQYGNTVRWIVIKILGTRGQIEIEECVSDVFVRLWQSIARFDETAGSSLSSWVYGIARHTALDYRRQQQRKAESLPLDEVDLKLELNLEDDLARKCNGQILRETIDALPEPDREIFIFRYFCEMSIKEIASQLSLSVKQIENKLYRGKLSLRKQLLERRMVR